MATSQIAGLIGFIFLGALIIVLRIWWRRHRYDETPAQKRREDQELQAEDQAW